MLTGHYILLGPIVSVSSFSFMYTDIQCLPLLHPEDLAIGNIASRFLIPSAMHKNIYLTNVGSNQIRMSNWYVFKFHSVLKVSLLRFLLILYRVHS